MIDDLEVVLEGGPQRCGHARAEQLHLAKLLGESRGAAMGCVEDLLTLDFRLAHQHFGLFHGRLLEVFAEVLGRREGFLEQGLVGHQLLDALFESAYFFARELELAQSGLVVAGYDAQEAVDFVAVVAGPAARKDMVADVERRDAHAGPPGGPGNGSHPVNRRRRAPS